MAAEEAGDRHGSGGGGRGRALQHRRRQGRATGAEEAGATGAEEAGVAAADEEVGAAEEEEQAGAAAEEERRQEGCGGLGLWEQRRKTGGEEAGWGRIRLRLGHKLGLILGLGCLMGFLSNFRPTILWFFFPFRDS